MSCDAFQFLITYSASVSDQHEPRCPVGPGEWEDGETQTAGGRGRLGAELHWKHAGRLTKSFGFVYFVTRAGVSVVSRNTDRPACDQVQGSVVMLHLLTLLSIPVSLQLYFVYWDMSRCLRALTETLEGRSFVTADTQVWVCHSVCPPPAPLIFLWSSHVCLLSKSIEI